MKRADLEQFVALSYTTDLSTILDQIDRLPSEQQEMLVDILRRRGIEQARRQIAEDVHEALSLYRAGRLPVQSVEEVIASLDKALTEPDDE